MSKEEKYEAVLNLVKERHEKKQPILIGTTSVENSEIISKLLHKHNVKRNYILRAVSVFSGKTCDISYQKSRTES